MKQIVNSVMQSIVLKDELDNTARKSNIGHDHTQMTSGPDVDEEISKLVNIFLNRRPVSRTQLKTSTTANDLPAPARFARKNKICNKNATATEIFLPAPKRDVHSMNSYDILLELLMSDNFTEEEIKIFQSLHSHMNLETESELGASLASNSLCASDVQHSERSE